MSSPTPAETHSRHASVLSPVVDLLSAGGLSILVFVPLLLSGRKDLVIIGAGVQAWLATLINMPHFMASYRLIYSSRESIIRHKWASIYIPALLATYIVIAPCSAAESPALVIVLITVASAYLAWHYTGQVWGMMASYAYLDGVGFDKRERLLIRTGLRILIAWHVSWIFYTQMRNPAAVRPLYVALSALTSIAFLLGLTGLVAMRRRTGRMPPLRSIVAWLAIFVWYAAMARDPKALFWVQIAHAIQYLGFPVRVEMNRAVALHARTALRLALYGVVLIGVSIVVSVVVPGPAMSIVANTFGEEPGKAAPILILMFINIHHYFTDGVIWHISNPDVRADLFAHVKRSSAKAIKGVKAPKLRETESPAKV
jgi:hypothetical protein